MSFHTVIPHHIANVSRLDCYRKHQLAWSVIQAPEKKERDFLFYLSTQSEIPRFHFVSATPLIIGLSKEIETPKTGDTVKWKILCNPVQKMGNRKIGIKDLPTAQAWLKKRLEPFLSEIELEAEFLPIASGIKPSQRSTQIFIQQMTAQGRGIVTDPTKLMETTGQGIGPSKAFGYGCLLWSIINRTKQTNQ